MLRGRQVSLRPAELGDADLLAAWWNDPKLVDAAEGRWPTRPEEIRERLSKKPNYNKCGEFLILPVGSAESPDDRPVGHVSFTEILHGPPCRCFEVGYTVHPDHRGRGYATAATRLLVNRLFSASAIHRVQAHCRTANPASERVLQKLGMTCEGTLRGLVLVGGHYEDTALYSILRPEWSSAEEYAARFGGL